MVILAVIALIQDPNAELTVPRAVWTLYSAAMPTYTKIVMVETEV